MEAVRVAVTEASSGACVHAGSIGSDHTKNCSEQVAAHGHIGEHVCMNHFDKFLGNKLSSLFNGKETK